MLKHVGQVINTGRRCVVVFREIYNEKGEVVEPDNCLIVETDSLPDMQHQDMMRIVEGEPAQQTGDLYNVLARERFTDGQMVLTWLNATGRLRKFPTNQILLTPDANNSLRLDKMNRIIEMQKAGQTQEQIENALVDDTDSAPRAQSTAQTAPSAPATEPGVLDDAALAKGLLEQAAQFESEVTRLREEAYTLDPSLKPKARRTTKKTTKKATVET